MSCVLSEFITSGTIDITVYRMQKPQLYQLSFTFQPTCCMISISGQGIITWELFNSAI